MHQTATVAPIGTNKSRRQRSLFVRAPRSVQVSLVILVGMLLCAVTAPWLAQTNPHDLAGQDLLNSLLPPAWSAEGDRRFLLGTDSQGTDLASLLLYGLRTSLIVAVLAVGLSVVLGTVLGLVAGYMGGYVDAAIMRLADVQFTFPAIILALLIGGVARLGLSEENRAAMAMPIVVLALGIAHWPHFARLVRAAAMVEKNKEYVLAARLIGHSKIKILTQILPNVLNPVFVLLTLDIGHAIVGEATLSFLGFGMPSTQPSLGTLVKIGHGYLFSGEWWIVFFPALALVLLIVSVNLVGDWLRMTFNPRLK